MLWRSTFIGIIFFALIAPIPQAVSFGCNSFSISPPSPQNEIIWTGSIRSLPNNKILYLTGDEHNQKLWLVNANHNVQFVANIAVKYRVENFTAIPLIFVYRDEKFIYLANNENRGRTNVEQIDLQTAEHQVLYENILSWDIDKSENWLFISNGYTETIAFNPANGEQVVLNFIDNIGRTSILPRVKLSDDLWLMNAGAHLFLVDLAIDQTLELSRSSGLFAGPFENTLFYIDTITNNLIQVDFNGNIRQEIPLQGDGEYNYLKVTAHGVVYAFNATQSDTKLGELYFINLTNNGEIFHISVGIDKVKEAVLVTFQNQVDVEIWYVTETQELYRVKLASPPVREQLMTEVYSIAEESGHLFIQTQTGYVTISNDGLHMQVINAPAWEYAVSEDETVYFRDRDTKDIFRYDYNTHKREDFGLLELDIETNSLLFDMFPVVGHRFMYFVEGHQIGVMSFDGAISPEFGQKRYLYDYSGGLVYQIHDSGLVFIAPRNEGLMYIQCHE